MAIALGYSRSLSLSAKRDQEIRSLTGLMLTFQACWGRCKDWRCRGRHKLYNIHDESSIQKVYKTLYRQQTLIIRGGNKARQRSIKPFPCGVTNMYRYQLLRICNDSTSKVIIPPTFRIVIFTGSLIAKLCPHCFVDVALKAADHSQRKLTVLGTLTLKCYSESSTSRKLTITIWDIMKTRSRIIGYISIKSLNEKNYLSYAGTGSTNYMYVCVVTTFSKV